MRLNMVMRDIAMTGARLVPQPNGWRCAALPGQATDASISAHGAAPTKEAQAPLRRPPTPLPCPDVGNVSTSALLASATV
jgi:hypothetical protein